MLKVGIIGLGVGESHIEGYDRHPDCEVVALCDINKQVVEKARTKYPGKYITSNPDEILLDEQINVVSIASYDHCHYDQILKGIDQDKHLFIEKPFVLFREEAVEIRKRLLAKPYLKVSSNLILRKTPVFEDLKRRLDSNSFGNLSFINASYHYGRIKKLTDSWRGDIPNYSIVLGGGIHLVDLMVWLTGRKVAEVYAVGNNVQTEGTKFKSEDLVSAILKFESGLVANLVCNFGGVTPHYHQFELYGTKQSFNYGAHGAYLYTERDVKNCDVNYLLENPSFPDYSGEVLLDNVRKTSKGEHIYGFIKSILNDTDPSITQKQIFEAMSICFAVEDSLTKKINQKVNYI